MLTHDIRTSLNGILGGLCTIDLSTLPEETRQQLERVHAASLVLASLVSQAIGDSPDISDAGALGATTNLEEFQEFLCRRWDGAAAGRDVEFVVDAEEGLPSALDCPAVNLSRMVGNLVSNAIRYTQSGSVHVKLSRAPKGGMDIVVRDTGPGVDESVLRAVSRPGFGDALHIDARNRLGLQIVKSLATELGGRFSLRNAAEGGTVAAIWLPERLFLWDHGATKPNLSQNASFPALAGARVLLAEDNPTNQMVATQMLSALDAVVSVASDGVEALEVFSREQFDLVVVDIEMPRLSGIDVIRAIRTLPDVRSRIPIVALTAYAMQEHKERIANAGANGLISKPITGIAEFGRALSVHMEPTTEKTPIPNTGSQLVEGAAVDRSIYDTLVVAVGADMRAELLDRVLADLAGARSELGDSLDQMDLKAVRSASHILISVGGAIGANHVVSASRDVNAAAHDEDLRGLPDKIAQCIDELDRAIAFVEGERRIPETA
ncbi:response regulator [Amaricoccus macauensis]|uniref:response regulator n=1 Tax=Amaricoccus macauensis TaxID=57001 RepID=UPI003C7DE196